jgi:hypothetical protein
MLGKREMRRRCAAGMLVALAAAWVAPAAHARQQSVTQADYEQFRQCLGVLHARNDMIHRLVDKTADPAYARKLSGVLSEGTKSLVALNALIEKANPQLDRRAGEAAQQAARYPYDASYTQPASRQLDLFRKGHGDGDKMFTPECAARVDAMISSV